MLRAGKVVDADRRGVRQVFRTRDVCVGQRCVAAPIFGGRVGEEDFGKLFPLRELRQQTVAAPRCRVSLGHIMEREQVAQDGIERAGGLSEALVEIAAALAIMESKKWTRELNTYRDDLNAVLPFIATLLEATIAENSNSLHAGPE